MHRTTEPEWPVLHAILAQGALDPTHDRLASLTGVSDRAISNVVKDFGAAKLVVGGHPARLGPGLGLAVGLSLGVESLRGVLVDANGLSHIELEDELTPDQLDASPEALLARLRSMAIRVLSAGVDRPNLWVSSEHELSLLGVAVAWPCPVDRSKRQAGKTFRDGGWRRPHEESHRLPSLPERTAAVFGGPFNAQRCHALNDVSAAALAVAFDESRARAADPDDDRWRVGLVVRVGGGVGAATIMLAPHNRSRLSFIDSPLLEGTNGLAGELGHLPIGRRLVEEVSANSHADLVEMDYDLWRCSCGHYRHLEAFASGAAVLRRLTASGHDISADGRGRMSMFRTALEGEPDDVQIAAVVDAGRLVGRALAGPILMLDPYSITLTGSLATDHLVDGIGRERDYWRNAIKDSVKVAPYASPAVKTGRFVGARGAALAVIRRLVYRRFLDAHAHVPPTFRFGAQELDQMVSAAS